MVVHFTIAVNYLCSLVGVIGFWRKKDEFWGRSFFYLLILSILATLAAGVAGVISESYITVYPHGVRSIFHTHKEFGEITGILLVIAFVLQWIGMRKTMWKVSGVALFVCLLSTVMVTLTGHLGGTMVYSYGFGVH